MPLSILAVTAATLSLVDQFDKSFPVTARLILSLYANKITYQEIPIPPYIKTYPTFEIDYNAYLNDPDKIIFLALQDDEPAGQIFLRENWNRFGYVENLVVSAAHRQHGIGRALMHQAIAWAKQRNLVGLMLETQDINVAACKFYARLGFQLKGFDQSLYAASHLDPPETALYWYLRFELPVVGS